LLSAPQRHFQVGLDNVHQHIYDLAREDAERIAEQAHLASDCCGLCNAAIQMIAFSNWQKTVAWPTLLAS
jgi:hypothetical protein